MIQIAAGSLRLLDIRCSTISLLSSSVIVKQNLVLHYMHFIHIFSSQQRSLLREIQIVSAQSSVPMVKIQNFNMCVFPLNQHEITDSFQEDLQIARRDDNRFPLLDSTQASKDDRQSLYCLCLFPLLHTATTSASDLQNRKMLFY